VIIAGFWTRETPLFNEISKYSGHQTYSQVLREGMLRSINTLLKMGRNVVIVSDIPILKIDPNRFFYIYRRFNVNPDIKKIFPTVDEYQSRNKDVIMILKEIEKFPKVTIVHPESMLFDNKGNIIFMFKKKPIYVDRDHLSTEGSIFISPVFEEIFQKMANKK